MKTDNSETLWIIGGVTLVFLCIFWSICWLEKCLLPGDVKDLHFWVQLATGSSWPSWEGFNTKYRLWFSLGVALHIMLNIGPFLGIVWLVIKVLKERRSVMNIAKAVAFRDEEIKSKLQLEFEGVTREQLDGVFERATAHWEKLLAGFIGKDGAREAIHSYMQKDL